MSETSLKEENYLKSIVILSEKNPNVGVKQISEDLNLKMPTVNAMMKKLAQKGYVNYETYKPITLTESGKLEALLILRKHRLTEMFLVKLMGLGWEEVHDIAEQLEHIKSPLFFDKMDEILGYPNFDPHGSPIPDMQGNIPDMHAEFLSNCLVNDVVIIRAVSLSSQEFLIYLNQKNIKIGSELNIILIEDFDKTMTIETGGVTMALSHTVTQKLLIEKK